MGSSHTTQKFENHRSMDYVFMALWVVVLSVVLLALISLIPGMPGGVSMALLRLGLLILAAANVVMMYKVRHYPIILQDRIIRLEMQVRLRRLLPEDRHWEINGLIIPQMVGLRFASDEELPELMRKVLDEHIIKPDVIKKLVKTWTPDFQRV